MLMGVFLILLRSQRRIGIGNRGVACKRGRGGVKQGSKLEGWKPEAGSRGGGWGGAGDELANAGESSAMWCKTK